MEKKDQQLQINGKKRPITHKWGKLAEKKDQ
jgi:hypothetical protein